MTDKTPADRIAELESENACLTAIVNDLKALTNGEEVIIARVSQQMLEEMKRRLEAAESELERVKAELETVKRRLDHECQHSAWLQVECDKAVEAMEESNAEVIRLQAQISLVAEAVKAECAIVAGFTVGRVGVALSSVHMQRQVERIDTAPIIQRVLEEQK